MLTLCICVFRRPRIRGPRRGRGVRVRGGQVRSGGSPLVVEVVEVVQVVDAAGVALDRGGPSGRRRGGRAGRPTRHERPGPRSIDELVYLLLTLSLIFNRLRKKWRFYVRLYGCSSIFTFIILDYIKLF